MDLFDMFGEMFSSATAKTALIAAESKWSQKSRDSKGTLTQRKIWHIKLSQLQFLRATEPAPAEVVRNARAGGYRRLHRENEHMDWYLGIIYVSVSHDKSIIV